MISLRGCKNGLMRLGFEWVKISVPTRSDFLGLWSEIGLLGANLSEKSTILHSKVRF